MLDKLGSFLYHKIFINIYASGDSLNVYIEKRDRKGLVNSELKNFKVTTIDDSIIKYIDFFTKDTPYFYVSLLDSSPNQGAAPTCKDTEIDKFYDKALSKHGCYEDRWSYYSSKS